jgi:hypothetical protein
MASIDFALEPDASPSTPPTGWVQPAWSDDAAVGNVVTGNWGVEAPGESKWYFNTLMGATAYAETVFDTMASQSAGPFLTDAAGNGYGMLVNTTYARVFLYTAGALVSVLFTTTAITPANGDTWRLATNTTGDFELFRNGISAGTFTDTTHQGSVYGGLLSRNTQAIIAEVTVNANAISIIPDDVTPNDGDTQTLTCAGMTGDLTAASISGKDILADLSSIDTEGAPITFTIDVAALAPLSDLQDGSNIEGMPRIGQASTISFTTVVDGAVTTSVTMQPKTGWDVDDLAATLVKGVNGYLDNVDSENSITTAIGNQNYYKQLYGESITPQGVYTGGTLVAFQYTEYVMQQGGSATTTATSYGEKFYPFEAGGGGTGLGFNNLTGNALTFKNLTGEAL